MKIMLALLFIILTFGSANAAISKNTGSKGAKKATVTKVVTTKPNQVVKKQEQNKKDSKLNKLPPRQIVSSSTSGKTVAKTSALGLIAVEIIDEIGDALEDDDELLSPIIPTLDSMLESEFNDEEKSELKAEPKKEILEKESVSGTFIAMIFIFLILLVIIIARLAGSKL